MLLAKVKSVAVVVLALAVTTAGSWGVLRQPGAGQARADDQPAAPEAAPAGQPDTWEVQATLHCRGPVWSVTFAPDGRRLAAGAGAEGAKEGELTLWDVASGKEVIKIQTDRAVRWVSFAPDGGVLVTAEPDKVQLRDARTGQAAADLALAGKGVRGVAFSPDGRLLATAAGDEGVRVLRFQAPDAPKVMAKLVGEGAVSAVAFSPDGKVLVTGGADAVRVWDAASGQLLRNLGGHEGAGRSLAITPDGRRIATAGRDGTIRLWDLATGKELRRMGVHEEGVASVAVSPDGKVLASAGSKEQAGEVVLLDLATGKVLARLRHGRAGDVLAVAFSPDGKYVAAAGRDGTVTIWRHGARRVVAAGGLVADRLDQLLDNLLRTDRTDEQIAEALYLATLGRLPTEGEKGRFPKADSRRKAFEQLLGALTASDEFRTHVEALQRRGALSPGY
jgi:Tol biopolymer transport system component